MQSYAKDAVFACKAMDFLFVLYIRLLQLRHICREAAGCYKIKEWLFREERAPTGIV